MSFLFHICCWQKDSCLVSPPSFLSSPSPPLSLPLPAKIARKPRSPKLSPPFVTRCGCARLTVKHWLFLHRRIHRKMAEKLKRAEVTEMQTSEFVLLFQMYGQNSQTTVNCREDSRHIFFSKKGNFGISFSCSIDNDPK